MKFLIRLALSTFVLLILSSCLKDEPVQVVELDMGSFQGSCKINTDRLKQLLKEHVYGEIDCIQKNLEQFSDFVQRDNVSYITKPDLKKFISEFFPKEKDAILKSLDLLFSINQLLLRDPEDHLSVKKLGTLFDIVKLLNKHAVPLNAIFEIISKDKSKYWIYRDRIITQIEQLTSTLSNTLNQISGPDTKMGIIDLLKKFKESMDLGDDKLDLELVKSFLFAKTLFVGGDKETIYTSDVIKFLGTLPNLARAGFDMLHMSDRPKTDERERDLLFVNVIHSLRNAMYPLPNDDIVFTHRDLMKLGEEFLSKDDGFQFKNIEPAVINIKEKIIGGESGNYTYKDITTVLDWGQEVLEKNYFNSLVYYHFKEIMENGLPIDKLDMPDLPEFKVFERTKIFKYWNSFYEIVTLFRVFHDENGIQYYTNERYRSLHGIMLKSLIRFGMGLALEKFGHPKIDPTTGKPAMMVASRSELEGLLTDLSTMFKELDMWPKYFQRFVDEAMNSSNLFQYNSDGDGFINLNEATEYVSNIISSTNLAKNMEGALSKFCEIVPDEDGKNAFLVPCYREYFFRALFEELNYRKYFQKLYDYTIRFSEEEVRKYIVDVESFAKEESDLTIPMSLVDIGRMFVSFSNVEVTFLRYDKNNSNILEYEEAMLGFPVFKKVLMEFGKLKESQEKLTKSVYLYILKEMKEPKPVALIWFHLFAKKEKITARRMNVGAILALVAKATIPK